MDAGVGLTLSSCEMEGEEPLDEALLEYEEFSEEINALSMPQALRVCEMEGIAPRAYSYGSVPCLLFPATQLGSS